MSNDVTLGPRFELRFAPDGSAPEDWPTVDFSVQGPQAGKLADLWSLYADLDRANSYCDEYLSPTRDLETERDVCEALFLAAIMSYERAFANGKSEAAGQARHKRLDDIIKSLDPSLKDLHRKVRQVRDKHLAHRGGDDRDRAVVTASYDKDGQFQGVSLVHMFRQDSDLEIKRLKQLIEAIIPILMDRIEDAEAELEAKVRELYPTVEFE